MSDESPRPTRAPTTKGRRLTEEHKAKIGAKAKERWADPEWLIKLAAKRAREGRPEK